MPRSGEENHRARLTNAQVKEMRDLYAKWKSSRDPWAKGYVMISRIFNCSPHTAKDIITYKTRIGIAEL